jgi:hypothetical protein
MSRPRPPLPAKLVIGVLTRWSELVPPLMERMQNLYGPAELVSPWFAFNWTRYYEEEMGPDLRRRMAAFGPLVEQGRLAEIKEQTNALEAEYMAGRNRRINIDPGYLLPERFVLATGKNYTHRIYIGRNMYADLTLIYQNGQFQPLAWTYPDYAQENIKRFLAGVRSKYLRDLKAKGCL